MSLGVSIVQAFHMPLLSVFGLRLGLEASLVGMALSLGSAVYVLTALTVGAVNSRLGPARTAAMALALLALSYAAAPHAGDAQLFSLLSCLASAAYGLFWPSVETIIAGLGGSSSTFSLSWSAGTLAGSLLSSAVLALPAGLAFYSMAVGMTAISVLQWVQAGRLQVDSGSFHPREFIGGFLSLRRYLGLSLVYAAVMGSILSFYPMIVERYGMPKIYVSACLFTVVLLRTLVFLLFERVRPIGRGYVGLLLVSPAVTLPFARSAAPLLLASSLVGIGQGLLYGVALSETFRRCGGKSLCTGLFEACIGIGYIVGPLVSSLAAMYSLEAVFIVTVATCWAIYLLSQVAIGPG